jgi:hypothetical protein
MRFDLQRITAIFFASLGVFAAAPVLSQTFPSAAGSRLETTPGAMASAPVGLSATGAPGSQPTYRLVSIKGGEKGLRTEFDPDQLALLEKLNRRDLPHLAMAKTLVVPEEWLADELLYSPLPLSWPDAEGQPKMLIVDQRAQVFGAYESGRLVRWGPISSGSQSRPTPTGLFHLNWRSKGRSSTDNPDWYMPWYFNFDLARGLAFHQLDLPGAPESHACIRMLERDAQWLYDWGEGGKVDAKRKQRISTGTPVLVQGEYDFYSPPPWLELATLAARLELPELPASIRQAPRPALPDAPSGAVALGAGAGLQ